MESGPPNTQEENPKEIDYESMRPDERLVNLLAEFFKKRQSERETNIIRKAIKEAHTRKKSSEILRRRQETAMSIGTVDPAHIENKKILDGSEKSAARAIWTMLWATPFIRSANKFDRRWEGAKKTLWEPFTKKTLGDLFKNIGKKMMEIG